MKRSTILLLPFYTMLIVSFFIPLVTIDLTDYEGEVKIMMGYDNFYFYVNALVVVLFNIFFYFKKSTRIFNLTITVLGIILFLDFTAIVLHPFTFGSYSIHIGFYLHYLSIATIAYLIKRLVVIESNSED
jgi:hypothetical protein